MHSVREALDRPWVLDIDASVKPLYGRQEGAEIGFNPSKPGRPSHVLHTFLVANLRLVLDVQVSSGKQHTSGHAKAALGRLLDELGDKRPALVRGDCGYGNEGILLTLQERGQPYLLRLRQTKNVQRLVAQQFARQDWSRADNQGCQMVEASLQLHGWSKKRRVVIVRQRIRGGIARERRVDGKQLKLDLAGPSVHEGERLWEYAVFVTDVEYPLEAIGQLYRDRADAENAFDELKVGPGGLHDAGHQPLPDRGAQLRAGLQLVELVLPRRAPRWPHGSYSPAARCCWLRWARPPTTPIRPRCTSRRCTAGPTSSND